MRGKATVVLVCTHLAGFLAYAAWKYVPANGTLFLRESRKVDAAALRPREGVISHLVEDFMGYDEFSESIDPFEDAGGLRTSGSVLGTSDDNCGGERSVRIATDHAETTISRDVETNLARWQDRGVLTVWLKLQDETEVDRIDLRLRDADGKEALLEGIELLHIPIERNLIKSDDDFPDHYFRGGTGINKWEDYHLIPGWNYVFWEYAERLLVDMSRIRSYEIIVRRNSATPRELLVDNLRIQDGLLRERNPLNGNWYAPNGLPQFGVFDVEGPGRLRLLNVEWAQYPSNGDHVRILSREGTPTNFVLRVRLKVVNLPPSPRSPLARLAGVRSGGAATNAHFNTFLRLQWDFDNEYDPGHDWSGIFCSAEYGYLGLRRVFPIERYFEQGSEPEHNAREARVPFRLRNGRAYEFDVKVTGQRAEAVVYEARGAFLKKAARVEHVFRKPRPAKRYPISIETTGNVQAEVHLVEVLSLD